MGDIVVSLQIMALSAVAPKNGMWDSRQYHLTTDLKKAAARRDLSTP